MESVDVTESEGAEGEQATTEIWTTESCPGRFVFSESDNPDGWIGTDLVVDVER